MFVNKDDDDDDEHDSGDYYINDHDKQDNSHDTVPWKGDNLNIQSYITSRSSLRCSRPTYSSKPFTEGLECLRRRLQQKAIGCCNCELDLGESTCH